MKIKILGVVALSLLLTVPSFAAPAKLSGIRDLMDRGCYQEAVAELTAIVEKDRENHAAFAMLGECEIVFQDLDAAETAMVTALDIVEDNNAGYWKLLGRTSFEKGIQAYANRGSANVIKSWFADAEVKFKQCQNRNDTDPEIRWWFGWAKEWQEYPIKARTAYDEQIAKFPKEPGGYLRLGNMLSQKANGTGNGFTDEAEKLRAEAIELFTTGNDKAGPSAEILYLQGLALEWQRKMSEAVDCYKAAAAADPEYDKAWRRMFELKQDPAMVLALAGKYPKSPTAAMWCAYYLKADSKTIEALQAVLPTLKDHGEHWGAFQQAFSAAMTLLRTDQRTGMAALEKLHEYNKFNADAANNLGLQHRDVTGRYKESLKWYQAAADRAPESQDIVNDLALIYLFHFSGAEQKKCLPLLMKVLSIVHDDGIAPERGYWDALENLTKYYWEVDRKPALVIKYADMRYKTTMGVEPNTMSGRAAHYKKLAQQ
jgi:tetratricopeptide (TPR) repeat protein